VESVIQTARAELAFGHPRRLGKYNSSAVMGKTDVSRAVALFSDTLQKLKPCVAERNPALLSR